MNNSLREEKPCTKCKITKKLKEFRRHFEGYTSRCKSCLDVYRVEHTMLNRESINLKARERYLQIRTRKLEYGKEYAKREDTKKLKYANTVKMYKKYPIKAKARSAVRYNLKAGKLFKKPCRDCGEIKVEAHHPDYSKPLDVVWLCHYHHRKEEGRSVV